MRFLVTFAISLVLLPLSFGQKEGFGRFGYGNQANLFGLTVSKKGIRPNSSDSDLIQFGKEIRQWNTAKINNWLQIVICEGGVGQPSKLRFDLFDYGVSAYFPAGISLKVSSTANPLLSWTEGSTGAGIPTPQSDWLAISYQDQQPPVVLGFPDSRSELTVSGKPGNWVISSSPTFKGWVRFSLPYGLEPLQTTTASSLGRLTKRCQEYENVWYSPVQDTQEAVIEEDLQGIEVSWQFPRKHAVVPTSLYLSPLGGYQVKFESEFKLFPSTVGEGPVIFTESPELKVRLPIVKIPVGRGLSIGEPILQTYTDLDWKNPLKIVNLALANTLAGRSTRQSAQATQVLQGFFESQALSREPNSQMSMFYDRAGTGLLQTAVHGLLGQSIRTAEPSEGVEDPQIKSLFWRLDPLSGSMGIGGDIERRVKAIAAIGASFCLSPRMRFEAAMFQVGISSERGLESWKIRSVKNAKKPQFLEPMLSLRKGLFGLTQAGEKDAVLQNWLSEMRVFGDTPVWLNQTELGLEIGWLPNEKQLGTLAIESSFPISVSTKRNLKSLYFSSRIGYFELRYEPESQGPSFATLYTPDWIDQLPLTALPPEYSEIRL